MQSFTSTVTGLFAEQVQYLIPLFQRGYVWRVGRREPAQVRYLWEDIVDRMVASEAHGRDAEKVGSDRLVPISSHFLGAIVLGPKQRSAGAMVDAREVIDGQQRLTTLQLLLLAFRDVTAAALDPALDANLRQWTVNSLRKPGETDALKVLPTNVGRREMIALAKAGGPDAVMSRWPASAGERPLMVEAYLYFAWIIEGYLRGVGHEDIVDTKRGREISFGERIARAARDADTPPELETDAPDVDRAWALHDTLANHLEIIELRLGDTDDPQVIFETLNARGEPLRPSDLIRNFLFLEASRRGLDVDRLYREHWTPFDEARTDAGATFWQEEQSQGRLTSARLDVLFYYVTTMRMMRTLKIGHVFEAFKEWWRSEPSRDIEAEFAKLQALAAPVRTALEPSRDTDFARFCWRMQKLETTTQVPLVLAFIAHHGEDSDAVRQVTADLESFCMRRFVCGYSTKSYSRLFSEKVLPASMIDGVPDPGALRRALLEGRAAASLWPGDEEFGQACRDATVYRGTSSGRVQALLWGIEESMGSKRQEYALRPDALTVEHVLPQACRETDYPARNPKALEERKRLMHTLGNLTLVTAEFNSALSNRPFAEKREELVRDSQLRLNAAFRDCPDVWDDRAILARSAELFEIARRRWPRPELALAAAA